MSLDNNTWGDIIGKTSIKQVCIKLILWMEYFIIVSDKIPKTPSDEGIIISKYGMQPGMTTHCIWEMTNE